MRSKAEVERRIGRKNRSASSMPRFSASRRFTPPRSAPVLPHIISVVPALSAQSRPLSRSTYGGLTLLMVVALAFQMGGAALPAGGDGHGCGNRVVEHLPVIAQAQITRRALQADRRVPAEGACALRADRSLAVRSPMALPSLVSGPVRTSLHAEMDLPPPVAV